MKNIKIINIVQFVFILTFVPVIYSEKINSYLWYFKIGFSLIGMISIFFVNKKYRYLISLFFLFCIAHCIPMILEKEVTLRNFAIQLYPFGIYCLIIYFASKSYKKFINNGYIASIFLVFIAIISLIIHILSGKEIMPVLQINRNGMQIYLTFIIGFILLSNFLEDKNNIKIRNIILLSIAFLLMIISTSATAFFAALVGIVLIQTKDKISIKILTIIYIYLFVFIVVLQSTNIPIFNYIFETFNKTSTFSSRTWRWKYSIKTFQTSVYFGRYDLVYEASKYAKYNMELFNPHNGILNILIYSGMFGMLNFILLLKKFIKSYTEIGNKRMKLSFLVVYTMTLITSLMESCLSPNAFTIYTFMILCIVYVKESNNEKEKNIEY